jgi:hypothetical protein
MDKRKLAWTAGGASIVAAALALNVGTAAAEGGDGEGVCTTFCGDVFTPMQKIESVIQKISLRFDKATPVVEKLGSILDKLDEIFIKFD